jgi:hypothetical protein
VPHFHQLKRHVPIPFRDYGVNATPNTLSGQVPSNNSRVVIATPRHHIVAKREHSATATMISRASLEVVDLQENTMMEKTRISTGLLLLMLGSILSVSHSPGGRKVRHAQL